MTVYVDDMKAKFGNMIMCHMIADTTEELLEMVDKIGVKRKWIQEEGKHDEHFDIALSKKSLAIKNGAIQVTWMQLGCMLIERKLTGVLPDDPKEAVKRRRQAVKKGRES